MTEKYGKYPLSPADIAAEFPLPDTASSLAQVDDPANPVDLDRPLWIVGQKGGSGYSDVDGEQYHFPTRIFSGQRIQEGHLVFCYRTQAASDHPDKGCIFGVGEVSDRKETEDGTEATIYFDPFFKFEPPIPLKAVGDPRSGARNSMEPVQASWAARVLRRAGLGFSGIGKDLDVLTVAEVRHQLDLAKLFLDERLVAQAVTALRAGKHLMLAGPPGTGKTTFAEALGAAAKNLGICAGVLPATATADWTSSDTVGAYRLNPSSELEFQPGQILQSIDEDRWIVIDELNRADIDKAVGQLFTVLSGQAVVLPFLEKRGEDGALLPPSIVPAKGDVPDGTHPHLVSENWRLIATLNDRDQDLLFDMSEALMRRFAVIEVGPPSEEYWKKLLAERASVPVPALNDALVSLSRLLGQKIGPAILIDCGAFLTMRWKVAAEGSESVSAREMLSEAIDCYIAPHFKNLSGSERHRLDDDLKKLVEGVVPDGLGVLTPSKADGDLETTNADVE